VVSEWEDKETGKKRSRVGVVAHSFEFMPREPKDIIPARGEPDQKREQEPAKPKDQPESDEHDDIPF
jgi:single-stranded DNA-binding protein